MTYYYNIFDYLVNRTLIPRDFTNIFHSIDYFYYAYPCLQLCLSFSAVKPKTPWGPKVLRQWEFLLMQLMTPQKDISYSLQPDKQIARTMNRS